MRIYRVIKNEEKPTIPLSKVKMEEGFLIVTADNEVIGIIVYDSNGSQYIMINDFWDDFTGGGIVPHYYNDSLEKLMDEIKDDYTSPVEFNFVRVEQ